ncbi:MULTISPECIES: hypothetical protein [Salarchaeum]
MSKATKFVLGTVGASAALSLVIAAQIALA